MNKKGVLGIEIADVVSLFVLVLILVLFAMYFYYDSWFGNEQEETIEGLYVTNAYGYLIDYLDSNIKFNNKVISVYDLLNFWYADNEKYFSSMLNSTRDILVYYPKQTTDRNWFFGTYRNNKAMFRSYYDPIHTTYNPDWGRLLIPFEMYNKDKIQVEFYNEEAKGLAAEAVSHGVT